MTDYKHDATTTTTTEQADSGLETWYKQHGLTPQCADKLNNKEADTVTLSRTVFEQMFTDTENTNKRAEANSRYSQELLDTFGELVNWHTNAIIQTMKRAEDVGIFPAPDFTELVEYLKDHGAIDGGNEELEGQIDEIRSELGRLEDMAGAVSQGLDDASYELNNAHGEASNLVSEIEGLRYTADQMEVTT